MEQTETEKYSQEVLQDYYDDYVTYRKELKEKGFISYQQNERWIVLSFAHAIEKANELIEAIKNAADKKQEELFELEIVTLHSHMIAAKHPLEWDQTSNSFVFKET